MLQEPADNHRDFVKTHRSYQYLTSIQQPAAVRSTIFLIPHASSPNKDKKTNGIWEGFEGQNPKIAAQKSYMR